MTDEEVSKKTGIYLYSAAPRRTELVAGDWVKDSGQTRPTAHGGDAAVWIATEKTLAAFRIENH